MKDIQSFINEALYTIQHLDKKRIHSLILELNQIQKKKVDLLYWVLEEVPQMPHMQSMI